MFHNLLYTVYAMIGYWCLFVSYIVTVCGIGGENQSIVEHHIQAACSAWQTDVGSHKVMHQYKKSTNVLSSIDCRSITLGMQTNYTYNIYIISVSL